MSRSSYRIADTLKYSFLHPSNIEMLKINIQSCLLKNAIQNINKPLPYGQTDRSSLLGLIWEEKSTLQFMGMVRSPNSILHTASCGQYKETMHSLHKSQFLVLNLDLTFHLGYKGLRSFPIPHSLVPNPSPQSQAQAPVPVA